MGVSQFETDEERYRFDTEEASVDIITWNMEVSGMALHFQPRPRAATEPYLVATGPGFNHIPRKR
jgi:hypothetical protein